ncbi:MAG: Ig-like domain-containing protein [Defluviitaleaceae bacterium]|nr:Ig-like domain-containing protein [Defluviitaleaceae bacterium]
MATSNRQQAIDQMLEAIASMENGLADIVTGEAGKIRSAIDIHRRTGEYSLDNLLNVNKSVESMMRKVIMKEMLLNFQMEDVVALDKSGDDPEPPEYPENISLICFAGVVPVGETVCYTPYITPSNAKNQTVTWESSDPYIATVDRNGCVTAISPGSTAIIVTTANNLQFKCEFKVGLLPESIELNTESVVLEPNNSMVLVATIHPSTAIDTVIWSVDDPSIVKVSSDGTILGIDAGTTIVRATTINGITASATVEVGYPPT